MYTPEMQQMHAAVTKALQDLDLTYAPRAEHRGAPVRFGPYHRAAAVLTTFDSATLRPDGSPTAAGLENLLRDSIAIGGSGPEDSVIDISPQPTRWTLLPDVRERVLRELGSREAMQHALDANPPRDRPTDTVQTMLEGYINHRAPELAQQNAAQAAGTLQVVQWLDGVLDDLPALEEVRRRQEQLSLLQPFEKLAAVHFRGRTDQLAKLRAYVGVLPPGSVREAINRIAERIFRLAEKPPLVIYGPGGVGKSALVARFIWEHVTLPDTERFPWAYIDFDRRGLLAEEPLTLLIEAVRQLGVQYPAARLYCDRVREQWQEELEQRARRLEATRQGSSRAADVVVAAASGPDEWKRCLRDFASLLGNLKVETDPFLFVLDTFEAVQYRSEVVVTGLCHFLQVFQEHVPRLRTVLAGRAPIRDVPDFPTDEVELGDFDPAAAQGFLQAHGVATAKVAKALAAQVGGNPLSLTLAVAVWKREQDEATRAGRVRLTKGLANLRTHGLFFRVQENEIQGQLYARILRHIRNPEVRKLAHPGLVLRRVTPALIREVLAEPCGIVVRDDAAAQRLFDELQREVWLVTVEDGALRHRQDVRRLMIYLLREDKPEQVRQIEEAAVTYYMHQEGSLARAEELYHRLTLKQPAVVLDERWQGGVQRYLADVLPELSSRERAWLAPRLGRKLTAAERRLADLEGWERDTERRVRELLERNQVDAAFAALAERSERTPASPLFALAAQAHEQREDWPAARKVIAAGTASADAAGDRRQAVNLRIRGAAVDGRLGDLTAARRKLDEAEELVTGRGDEPLRSIEIDLHRLALSRAVADSPEAAAALQTRLRERFDRLSDEQVAEQPALMGWLASELGPDYPEVLGRVVRLTGLPSERTAPLRTLANALAAWDSEVSRQARVEPGLLLRNARIPEAETLTDAWTAFLLQAEPSAVREIIVGLLGDPSTVSIPVRIALSELLRARAHDLAMPTIVTAPPPAGAPPADDRRAAPVSASDANPRDEATAEYAPARLRLRGAQLEQFWHALLAAFPNRDALAEMVRFRLGRSLDAIALAEDPRETTSRLIWAAEREGWTAQLLAAARDANPDNADLLAFAVQFGLAPVRVSSQQLERLLPQSGGMLDAREWRSRLGRIETQICRVEVDASNDRSWATGFLLGPDLVMTTYHALDPVITGKTDPSRVALRFDYARLADGTTVTEGTVYRLVADWLVDASPPSAADLQGQLRDAEPRRDELDYALVRVAGTPGNLPIGGERAERSAARRGWITLPEKSAPLRPDTPLLILQHARGGPLQLSFEPQGVRGLNGAGTRVYYNASTDLGASGAPCFDANWQLVAMHQGQQGRSHPATDVGIPMAAIIRLLEERGKRHLIGERLP